MYPGQPGIGQYDCVASIKYGTDRSIRLLQVKQGPRFTGPQSTKPNYRVSALARMWSSDVRRTRMTSWTGPTTGDSMTSVI